MQPLPPTKLIPNQSLSNKHHTAFLCEGSHVDRYIDEINQRIDEAIDRQSSTKEGFIDLKEQIFIECVFSTLDQILASELGRLMPMKRLQSIIRLAQENDHEIISNRIRTELLAKIILAVYNYRLGIVMNTNSFMPNLSLQELVLFKAILKNTSIVRETYYSLHAIIALIDTQIEKLSLSVTILPKAGNPWDLTVLPEKENPYADVIKNVTVKTNDSIYQGCVNAYNLPHGPGIMLFQKSQDLFIGIFADGKLKSGVIYWNGVSHCSASSKDEFHYSDYCQCDEFIDNQINGQGMYRWEGGQNYEGDMVNGIPRSQTKGTFKWKNPEGEICEFAGIFNATEILIQTTPAISPAKCNFTGQIYATGEFVKNCSKIEGKTLKLSFTNGKIVQIEVNTNENDSLVPLSADGD